MAQLLRELWTQAGARPAFDVPAGVEATRRLGDEGSYLFLLNHSAQPARIGGAAGHELITGRDARDGFELGAREIGLIVASDRTVSV
jgi:beta-galactosidase